MSEDSAAVQATKDVTGPAAGTGDGVAPNSSTTLSTTVKRSLKTPAGSTNTSAANSPQPSREPSPSRPSLRSGASSSSRGLRSRKNSQDIVSPSRRPSVSSTGGSSIPSAAAVQRALSVANTPHLQPTVASEPSIRAPRSQHSSSGTPVDNTPHWPVSPRLKSPPNANSTKLPVATPRNSDSGAQPPSIQVQRPTPVTSTRQAENRASVTGGMSEDHAAPTIIQKPSRGASAAGPTLETVQESSLPATPAIDSAPPAQANTWSGGGSSARRVVNKSWDEQAPKTAMAMAMAVAGSGSESGENKSDGKGSPKYSTPTNAPKTNSMPPLKSFTSTLNRTRAKPAKEGSTQNMTVETETVSSIPQVAVGGGAGERGLPSRTDTGGSLRLKPSTETIRPKKDRKKTVRKAPSVHSGTGGFYSRFPRSHHHHTFSRQASWGNFSSSPLPSSAHTQFAPHDYASASSNSSSTCWDGQISIINPESGVHSSASSTREPHSLRVSLTKHGARTASSKADIFEAKVASAVDEANSSDSEETFVYESNPPDPHPSRSDRYHSRTPSATSMKSQIGQRGAMRSVQNLVDGTHTVAGKRSMKFTNNFNNSSVLEGDAGLHGDGTVRKGHPNNTRGATGNGFHHHIGHYGRGGGGHTSLFDNNSPFPHASKPPRSSAGNTPRIPSAPSSPRSPHYMRLPGVSGKKLDEVSSYDIEADDERTPLVGSVRSNRIRQSRRPNSGTIRQMKLNQHTEQGWFARFACCIALTALIVVALLGAVAFLFATTKPLFNVGVREIQNVLASEQAIMLDLLVEAVNPNVIAVTVSDMDVNIFAKSEHVGSDQLWRDGSLHIEKSFGSRTNSRQTSNSHSPIMSVAKIEDSYRVSRGIDKGNDPIPDLGGDESQTMLLGRIFEFDSALSFDGSPFRRRPSVSVGELRLAKPGNRTEQGGTQRWERVIQHQFELIVRGVLKYQLPLSARLRTAPIGASILVHAEEGVNAVGSMRLESVRHPYQPGSNVLIEDPRRSTGT
ncbi:MAG: hypothetical protein M1812_000181 [Candelaria pacifica]|nr:MAG: hypothetical protein M1812_000181 [Candelaria pacifica]